MVVADVVYLLPVTAWGDFFTACRRLLKPGGQFLLKEVVPIEGLGINVSYNIWVDPTTRNLIGSMELMFGANKGITSGTIASVYNP